MLCSSFVDATPTTTARVERIKTTGGNTNWSAGASANVGSRHPGMLKTGQNRIIVKLANEPSDLATSRAGEVTRHRPEPTLLQRPHYAVATRHESVVS